MLTSLSISSVLFLSQLIVVSFLTVKYRCLLISDQRAAVQEKIRNPKISKHILLPLILADIFRTFFLACWIVVASLQMLSFMYAHLTFFHQGYDLFSELQPLMKLLGGQVNTRIPIHVNKAHSFHSLFSYINLMHPSVHGVTLWNPENERYFIIYLFFKRQGKTVVFFFFSYKRMWLRAAKHTVSPLLTE